MRIFLQLTICIGILVLCMLIGPFFFSEATSQSSIVAAILIISVAYTAATVFRSKKYPEEYQAELASTFKVIPLILNVLFVLFVLGLAASPWFGADLVGSLIALTMLYAYTMNELPTKGAEVFREPIFKKLYFPGLIVSTLSIILGAVINAI